MVSEKKNFTPYELWHGKKPDISNLRVFGSPAYVFIPDAERQKLDPKAIRGLYIDECESQKASRIFIESTGRTIISRHVKVYENFKDGEETVDANSQTTLEPNMIDTFNYLDSNCTQTSRYNPAQMLSTEDKTTTRKRKEPTNLSESLKEGSSQESSGLWMWRKHCLLQRHHYTVQ